MKRCLILIVCFISFVFALYTAVKIHTNRFYQQKPEVQQVKKTTNFVSLTNCELINRSFDKKRADFKKLVIGHDFFLKHGELKKGELYNRDSSLQRVPVLCYHRIDKDKSDIYYCTKENFIWQMRYLARYCTVISTARLVNYIRYQQGVSTNRVTLPPDAVVVQFDDNYRSVYRVAYPILKRLGLKWTFFIYKYHHRPNKRIHLVEMAQNGVDIQSHSMTHPLFHKPAKKQSMKSYIREMYWQVGGSKKYLQRLSGRPVRYLAYPFGTYSDLAVALCKRYGYQGMFAADGGYATAVSPLHAIERILVTKGWSRSFFKRIVAGKIAYRKQFMPTRILSSEQLWMIGKKPVL